MATHNQVRVVGFLIDEPNIINEGDIGNEKVLFTVRTARREIEGYRGKNFADLVVIYDGEEMIKKCKELKKFDVVDIKGVFNIITTNKKHKCTECGYINIRYNCVSTFIYPLWLNRIASYKDYYAEKEEMPNRLLIENYKEISNQCLIVGTVVTEPEFIEAKNKCRICRYALGVDRKQYINTQNDITADYPWVYSYGKQADSDKRHLLDKKTLVLVDGFIHNEKIRGKCMCEECKKEFTFFDIGTQFTPYSVEYLNNYKTDEEIALEEEMELRRRIAED